MLCVFFVCLFLSICEDLNVVNVSVKFKSEVNLYIQVNSQNMYLQCLQIITYISMLYYLYIYKFKYLHQHPAKVETVLNLPLWFYLITVGSASV